MEKLKSSLSNMVLVLVGFAVVIGAVLAWVNHITEDAIAAKAEKTLAEGIKEVMGTSQLQVKEPKTVTLTLEGKPCDFVIHEATDNSGKALGAAVESTTQGFGGDLKVLVGFAPDGRILGYTILQSSETPGLGMKAAQWFQKDGKGNIIGMNPKDGALTVKKDGGQVDAITASTITSRAFLKAVNQAYQVYAKNSVGAESGASKHEKE